MRKIDKLYELYKRDREYVINNKSKVAKQIPMDHSSVCKAIKKWESGKVSKNKKKFTKKMRGGGGLEAFQKLYDDDLIIPQKIDEGIEKYLYNEDGEPDWLYDREFRELCGVSISKWRRYADDYKHLQVRVKEDLVWAHPGIIEELRRMVQR